MIRLGYKSPRSAAKVINDLIQQKILVRKNGRGLAFLKDVAWSDNGAMTINIPVVGVVSCGTPILSEENIQATIPVSVSIAKPPYKYFLVKAKGDSMNLGGIIDGDLVLVRKQSTAESGDNIVALIDNEVTIKQMKVLEDTLVLMPKSSNTNHAPIILSKDFRVQGVVVRVISLKT